MGINFRGNVLEQHQFRVTFVILIRYYLDRKEMTSLLNLRILLAILNHVGAIFEVDHVGSFGFHHAIVLVFIFE